MDETAQLLNTEFISIKVDREERPDLDHIYMAAVQALTSTGLAAIGFSDLQLERPHGGTHFPPEDRHGIPSFKKILSAISQAWKTRPREVAENASASRKP